MYVPLAEREGQVRGGIAGVRTTISQVSLVPFRLWLKVQVNIQACSCLEPPSCLAATVEGTVGIVPTEQACQVGVVKSW